jgi:hypothetical protein
MVIVIVSVVFGVIYEIYKKHIEFKMRKLAHENDRSESNSELIIQIEKLTDRIQVLEKIVTDEGYQVQKDINNLK